MVPYRNKLIIPFFILALGLLTVGLFFGFYASLEYVFPGISKKTLSFEKLRPLHVSSVVFWILTAAMGAVLSFLQEHTGRGLKYPKLVRLQMILFSAVFIAVLISYFFGIFGGREYWEFHPLLAIPIILGWILFIINVFASIKSFKKQPVYIWMWLTGAVFFLFTYTESNLWWFPWFRSNIVHDMTIQWKSYGALVGAWNMLIYGSSIYLMDKIAGNTRYSYSSIAFWLYFLGLFNGMFNWGHHIYTLPTFPYVHYIAYIVSMTELIIFARIIFLWRDSLSTSRKFYHHTEYKFLMAADFWIFVILGTAIAMSVPALNIYMHGTHVIVAHTMGATIGINSMLLMAFTYDFARKYGNIQSYKKLTNAGYMVIQVSLIVFIGSLLIAGFIKGFWQLEADQSPFSVMMDSLHPYFVVFSISGLGVVTGFYMVIYPVLSILLRAVAGKSEKREMKSEQIIQIEETEQLEELIHK